MNNSKDQERGKAEGSMTGQRGNDRIELGAALAAQKNEQRGNDVAEQRRRPIPTPMFDAERAVRIDLAACYRLVALYGWDDLVPTFTEAGMKYPGDSKSHTKHLLVP